MSSSFVPIHRQTADLPWSGLAGSITVGRDIVELLSTSMYVDPMSIYREYVQNAADAIDDARDAGSLAKDMPGRIEFSIDPETRTVGIRDNGIGVPVSEFVERLTAFGASHKRGRSARGFRGVGRLGGLGYCRELLFRTRAGGEGVISELRWDCQQLKLSLRSESGQLSLRDAILAAVSTRRLPASGVPEHFFEVELRGIIRHRNDQLLDAVAIHAYLAQVAPVPFAPDFCYGRSIADALRSQVKLGEVEIKLPGMISPVCRPHRNDLEVGGGKTDAFTELEMIKVPGIDGDTAAVGWVLHHGYSGALPRQTLQKGLRFRVGNIQVGNDRLLEELFAEPRFNSWSVGEFHVIDPRVVPNGRRDHFEQNTHYLNILSHLTPLARELSKRCRNSSIQRNRWRDFMRQIESAKKNLMMIEQGVLGKVDHARILRQVHVAIAEADRLAARDLFSLPATANPRRELQKLKRAVAKAAGAGRRPSSFANVPIAYRKAYQQVFSLIYEFAPSQSIAKRMIDRIIARLARRALN